MSDYVIRVHASPLELDASAWDGLLQIQSHATPFMRHAYLSALHQSGSACADTCVGGGHHPDQVSVQLRERKFPHEAQQKPDIGHFSS